MLQESTKDDFKKLVEQTTQIRNEVRELVHEGKWKQAEPDENRKALFSLKHKIRERTNGAESLIGDTLDWVDVHFFTEGYFMKKAVGYVSVQGERAITTGTGFMISETLFMTNNHVIESLADARVATVSFNKENDELGKALPVTKYRLDPDTFFAFSPQQELDYSIIAIGAREFGELNASELGYFILSDAPDKHVIGMNVNIIQHPLDLPKKVTFRNNPLVVRTDNTLLYETDTEHCSSGSPVCNDYWDLVAIHHWGEPYQAKRDNPDSDLPNAVNEGIRVSRIYRDLSKKLEEMAASDGKELLLRALSFAKTQPAVFKKIPTTGPPAGSEEEKPPKSEKQLEPKTDKTFQNESTMANQHNELKITIPLELTIRLGDLYALPSGAVSARKEEQPLNRKAEANKIDADYSNRSGYDPDFIPGFTIPLPKVKNLGDIAPLKEGEAQAAKGVLQYEHFAIILNRKKRCAFFSATNIDGKTYKRINRDTGEIKTRREMNEDEGEKWYNDPRVDEKYHLNQPFFSGWSHLFDRGHLTRRTDPSWGSDKVALRADADTFHFSNCSIQHFRFNQTVPYWQGLERYVLENGFLQADENKHLIVFQGPVYNNAVDLWAEDFQIPSRYFKIAVWKGANGLKSVGLVADQKDLLDEERRALGQPREVAEVNVNQWRVPIAEIETLTGLDFGKKVGDADTIGDQAQPDVGGEAFTRIPVKEWRDLLR